LTLTPTIVAPELPNIVANNYATLWARLGIPSAGNGIGTGIGGGRGPGVGPGSGADSAAELTRSAEASAPPFRCSGPSPSIPKKARKAKWQGAVLLQLVVDENGVPQDIKVVRSLGWAWIKRPSKQWQKWRFKPGLKDGKAVPSGQHRSQLPLLLTKQSARQ